MKLVNSHLSWLESESIHILREAVAEARNPVMLFSAGKDSTVMAHLALRAFYPSKPPFPLLHVDSTWEFRSLIEFRDQFAAKHGFELIAYSNEEGRAAGINPFDHGDHYTLVMRTEPLKAALDLGGYDIIFGGARRDEEKSPPRPVVQRSGAFVVVDEESRMRFQPGDEIQTRTVRFRTLGCWPVTGAVESDATDLAAVVDETLRASSSERQGRISDGEDGGSLEQKKREGYF